MNEELEIDAPALIEEIGRYLAAVDAFRAAGNEPTWRPELPAAVEARHVVAAPQVPHS